MQKYDPMLEPDPEWWEALDDDERISVDGSRARSGQTRFYAELPFYAQDPVDKHLKI